MSEPLVVHLPRARSIMAIVVSLALSGWGLYLVTSVRSVFDVAVGIMLLVLFVPGGVIVGRLLWKNQPVLTVTDAGLETPKLGAVQWFEISALKVDENGLELRTYRVELHVPRGRMDVKPMALRAEIETRSGGSWFSGQWSSRAS